MSSSDSAAEQLTAAPQSLLNRINNQESLTSRLRKVRRKRKRSVSRSRESSDDDTRTSTEPKKKTKKKMKKKTVAENNSFKVTMRQINHTRRYRFNFNDHLYEINFEPKTNQPVFVIDLMDLIHQTLVNIINELKQRYPADNRHQLYTTLIQRNILRGLNSGNFDINTDAEIIANHMLNMLENYIQSNMSLQFDDSLKLQVKVLSVDHTEHNNLHKKDFIHHIANSLRTTTYPKYILSFPAHCLAHNSNCFLSKCLIIAIFIGLCQHNSEKTYSNIEQILLKSQIKKRTACMTLHYELDIFMALNTVIPVYEIGTIPTEGLNYFSTKYSVQFHIFDSSQNYSFLMSTPTQLNFDLKQIYLCLYNDHITLIRNYHQFCLANKFYCFHCGKYFKTKRSFRHLCHKFSDICFACLRPYLRQSYTLTDRNYFCDSSIHSDNLSICTICNITIRTSSCNKAHKLICKKGVKFDCCGKYRFISGQNSNRNKLIENHVCSSFTCRYCHLQQKEKIGPDHQCKMKKYIPSEILPQIGFFSFLTENTDSYNCEKCRKSICDMHTNENILSPAVCHIYTPTQQTNIMEVTEVSNYFPAKIKYKQIRHSHLYTNEYRPVQLQSKPRLEELKNKKIEFLTILEQLLFIIITEKMFGLTFLCYNNSGVDMFFILKMFANSGIIPKVIQSHQDIKYIQIKSLDLKFINLNNFFQFDYILSFFPTMIINERSIGMNIVPTLDDYVSITDTSEMIKAKEGYYNQICFKNWNFYHGMSQYLLNKIEYLIKECAIFLAESFEFQKMGFAFFNKTFQFYHPFTDSSSKSGYIFKLFQIFHLNDQNMYALNNENGIFVKYSQPEAEYVQYLQSTLGYENIITAFSPFGQKKYKYAIPDAIQKTEKIAYMFNGCEYHAHSSQTCPIMKNKEKNFLKKNKHQERLLFNKKMDNLIKHSKGTLEEVKVMWECEWQNLKTKNTQVQQFMTSYNKRPKSRLIPRDACKYLAHKGEKNPTCSKKWHE